jgi:flap endonuclease-1
MEGLGLSEEEFIDMCILCGCDYASKIEGIGPVKAYKFIKDYKNL